MEIKRLSRKPRVIIIGAGISGLSAARRLYSSTAAARDWQITVLEASDRTGGRILTSRFNSEQIEIGATWIHGVEGSPIFEIAEKSGALEGDIPFECMDGYPEPSIVKAQGGATVDSTIAQSMASLYRKFVDDVNDRRGEAPEVTAETLEHGDAGNLGSYLRRRLDSFLGKQAATPGEANAAELLLKQDNSPGWSLRDLQKGAFAIQENWERCVTAAESLEELDLLAFNEYWEFPGEQITIAKGFSSIIQALAKSLPPGTIRFHKKVDKIVWSDEARSPLPSGYPVKLHCDDGSTFEADHVLVTVSLGVLKARALEDFAPEQQLFHPRLPGWKLESIKKLGFGVVDKLFILAEPPVDGSQHPNLQFIHKPSEDVDDDEVPRWIRKTHSIYPIHKKSDVLVAWFAGAEAKQMETLADEEIARGVQKTLAAFGDERRVAGLIGAPNCCNGGEVSKYSKVHVAHGGWNRNPLFLGSYSYVAVGSSGEDIDQLAQPVPQLPDSGPPLQLLFAGEATHREQYSTTHGAFFSGQREADRLLKHYKVAS